MDGNYIVPVWSPFFMVDIPEFSLIEFAAVPVVIWGVTPPEVLEFLKGGKLIDLSLLVMIDLKSAWEVSSPCSYEEFRALNEVFYMVVFISNKESPNIDFGWSEVYL